MHYGLLVYDTPLTIDEVLTRLAEQPREITAFTAGLPRARLHRAPGQGEWSVNDVLAHLRSCADIWGKYMATIIAEDRPTIRAMNPTTWIKSTNYPDLEFASSFRAFLKQRAGLLRLLRPLPKAAWSRTAMVTGAGRPRERTVLEYARWLANHERTHVKHIARIVNGSTRRTA
jgi:DinB family protein